MNQEQVKEKLKLLENVPDFEIIFSGKSSKKVDGLYRPDSREIIIHNRNMNTDSQIMYTAIHEFAHHVHFCHSAVPVSNRAHTNEFWSIFHNLLRKAEKEGIYNGGFDTDPDLVTITREIREKYISGNGKMMIEFGKTLIKAMEICKSKNIRFEDYLDRVLLVPRDSAMTIISMASNNINPEIGYENMKIIAGISNPEKRKLAEENMLEGQTAVMVKNSISPTRDGDPLKVLQKEKMRLERAIESMQHKIKQIDERISKINK